MKLSEQSPEEIRKLQEECRRKNGIPCSRGCGGIINFGQPIPLQTGCCSHSTFFPCDKCGRVHDKDGAPINNRSGDEVFFIDGYVELKPEELAGNPH